MTASRGLLSRFLAARNTSGRGAVGERAARRWLEREGFEVVTTNFRAKPGEIDLIAIEAECLCFVEIKARSGRRFGCGLEAVPVAKQRRIARVASAFLSCFSWDGPCRFDVLGVDAGGDDLRFELIRDAFWVGDDTRRPFASPGAW